MHHAEEERSVLLHAYTIAGDEFALADRLGVNVEQLLLWTTGREPVPAIAVLVAAEIIKNSRVRQSEK